MPPSFTIAAPFIRSSISRVAGSASRGDPGRRAQRHRAADRRIDRVGLAERVAQDAADDFAQVGALEVQHDAVACRLHRRARRERAAGLLPFDEDARAPEDPRALVGGRQAGLLGALRGVREVRRHAARRLERRRAHRGACASGAGPCDAQAASTSGSARTSARRKGERVGIVVFRTGMGAAVIW